ncbi:S9 family peptidase [Thalassobacillus sp. CUG 92003]|uniref:alpha/beta hydrolase family protein n=1 Tax=Thalassobacillus sp. CUG 92003 TaxID=2736641 RepID=UPI0015E77E13|nr:alpha/beta fold hydrolase [Thalassobacillus sp. CUG 92003]
MMAFVRHQDILGELYLPEQAHHNGIGIVWLPGLPNKPTAEDMGLPLSEAGFTVFQPRYPGSWQSYGSFGPATSVEGARLGLELLDRGRAMNLNTETEVTWSVQHLVLIGNSYGGGIAVSALAASSLADAAIAFCPLLEPSRQNTYRALPEDDLTTLYPYLKRAHENVFRHLDETEWQSYLEETHPLAPSKRLHDLRDKRLLFIHGTEDTSIRIYHTQHYYNKLTAFDSDQVRFICEEGAGHGKHLRQATKDKWIEWLLQSLK